MRINSSQKAYKILKQNMDLDVEEFRVLALNSNLEILDKKLLFRGTVDHCLVHPRDLIKFLCTANASAFIMAHSHPSNDPRPSRDDIRVTKKFVMISTMVEIPMKDHLILSKDNYFSFADSGMLQRYFQLRSLRLRP
jgi:DNA repair protein RadC